MSMLITEQEFVASFPPYAVNSSSLVGGRYRLCEQVGQGGFSRVYRADDTFHEGNVVAIKQLCLSGLHPGMRTIAREILRREAATLTSLQHPQIPRLHELISVPGWYLVLDFIEGETLERRLARQSGPLPIEEVLEIGRQISSILCFLHQRKTPVLFLDLKPANVMLTPAGQVFLVDFGLARVFQPGSCDTFALGTHGYCAPEQYPNAQGNAYPQPGSDIYSFGILLQQMFSGPNLQKFRCSHASLSYVQQLVSSKSKRLLALIHTMLESKPQNRPTILQVNEALHRL